MKTIKFNNCEVEIKDCKIGTVIQTLGWESLYGRYKVGNELEYGHIVGFGKNTQDEILMNVKLMPNFVVNRTIDDEVRSIHPANLNIFI